MSAPVGFVNIKSTQWNTFLNAATDGVVHSDATSPSTWEKFDCEPATGGYSFRSSSGFYLTANSDGSVQCRAGSVGAWEIWQLTYVAGTSKWNIKNNNFGKFLTANNPGVTCSAVVASTWEQFQFTAPPN